MWIGKWESMQPKVYPGLWEGRLQSPPGNQRRFWACGWQPKFRTRDVCVCVCVRRWANHSIPLGFSDVRCQMGPGPSLYSSNNRTRTWLSHAFRNSNWVNPMVSLLAVPGKASSAFSHLGKTSASLFGVLGSIFGPPRYRCSWLILESRPGVISRNASLCGGGTGPGT